VGLALCAKDALECMDVQMRFSQQALELAGKRSGNYTPCAKAGLVVV